MSFLAETHSKVMSCLLVIDAEGRTKIFPLGYARVPGDTLNIHFKEEISSVTSVGAQVCLTSVTGLEEPELPVG